MPFCAVLETCQLGMLVNSLGQDVGFFSLSFNQEATYLFVVAFPPKSSLFFSNVFEARGVSAILVCDGL